MVEVFRTNVNDRKQAKILLDQIHHTYPFLKANFDLDDCDRILRVESKEQKIEPNLIIDLLQEFGFGADVLSDNFQPLDRKLEEMI
jgi:hypothetical protein